MDFRSFFTIWDGRQDSRAALILAMRLAKETEGHLDILCISPTAPDMMHAAEASIDVMHELTSAARLSADKLKEEAQAIADSEGVSTTIRPAPVRYSEVARVVGREGRFHDLIVMPRPFPAGEETAIEDALEGALFDTIAPVLVCPPGAVGALGKKIMVAWNGDQEAMRAIRAALPMLKVAEQVEVVMVDPQSAHDSAAPGFALMTMLARQGVNAILSPIAKTAERVSDTLREKARDMGADMIVMGAYGHSRFRERLLGGATREMLQDAETPVLMTH